MDYWKNAITESMRAKKHTMEMAKKYQADISKCVSGSAVYTSLTGMEGRKPRFCEMKLIMSKLDTVKAIFQYAQGKTAALNFASYKEPGGKFLDGSKAQEECLCHESFLYNVLKEFPEYYKWNNQNLNRALYLNRAVYSPNIRFFNGQGSCKCDVITCAAPNFAAASKYCHVKVEENKQVLEGRMRFILSIAAANNIDTLILGAYGCGVFGQDPFETGKLWGKLLKNEFHCFPKVVFAVLGDNNYEKLREGIYDGFAG